MRANEYVEQFIALALFKSCRQWSVNFCKISITLIERAAQLHGIVKVIPHLVGIAGLSSFPFVEDSRQLHAAH